MKEFRQMPGSRLRALKGVLFDLDDTFTSNGRIGAAAYSALWTLSTAGLITVPITGRPAGWCDMIARMWPVRAVVGENGAFYFAYDPVAKRMQRRFEIDEDSRRNDRARLDVLCKRILNEVAGSGLSADQPYRVTDLAIDYREDVAPLDGVAVAHIVALFHAVGAAAKVSSIHVNGWFGEYDKLSMTRRLFQEHLALDLDHVAEQFVFIGDSPNDSPMFEFFPYSVGVANVLDTLAAMPSQPNYVTRARSGDGFAEVAEIILAARR